MQINIFYSLVVAAILQGFWLSFFILHTKKYNTKSSKFLGLLILVVTVTQLQYFLEEAGIITLHQFNAIHLPYEFLQAPFLFLFVSFYLNQKKEIQKSEKALFLPALFFFCLTIIYKLIAFTTSQNWQEHTILIALADVNTYFGEVVNILLLLTVLMILLLKIFKYGKEQKYNHEIIDTELMWLKILLFIILVVILFYCYYVIQFFKDENTSYIFVVFTVSLLIYVLGYIGIHKLKIAKERENIRSFNKLEHSNFVVNNFKSDHQSKIETIMVKNRRFLDPNFSSEILAEELQISKSHLSRIFNNEMKISFTDYVNSLRVEEAKIYLQSEEFINYTLVAIGLEAGFNSKTTFNTTFKKITGQTPSQFRKSI